ncbi:hypothetical protein [Terriglobus tenax]|nr:hypothetical protein [Terriglobus tenax]
MSAKILVFTAILMFASLQATLSAQSPRNTIEGQVVVSVFASMRWRFQ